MNMPGFTAAQSLVRASRHHVAFHDGERAGGWKEFTAIAAERVPGGPGNVPVGYNRECKRVPYTVCDMTGCRTEYGWVCYFTPIART